MAEETPLTIREMAVRLGLRPSGLRALIARGVIRPPTHPAATLRGYSGPEVAKIEKFYHSHTATTTRGKRTKERRERSAKWLALHTCPHSADQTSNTIHVTKGQTPCMPPPPPRATPAPFARPRSPRQG